LCIVVRFYSVSNYKVTTKRRLFKVALFFLLKILLYQNFFVFLSFSNEKITKIMKKFLTLLTIATLAITFISCNDKPDPNIDPPVIPVTGVTLNQDAATLGIGNTLQLTATVLPSNATQKNVTWTSSNTDVAIVENGKITAKALGTANIIVATTDGNKIATCVVTVNPISVVSVALSQTSATLNIGDTLILAAIILPINAGNQNISWKSSDSNVATIANGKITAKTAGVTNIIVTTEDGNKTSTCAITVIMTEVTEDWNTEVFGMASFATHQIWTIGSQTWSDALQTSFCRNKVTFNGNSVDCRSNPGQKGDLFSGYAVSELKNQLCPSPWRVPTVQDFIDLDVALGGTGNNRSNDLEFINSKYLNPAVWGGTYGGYSFDDGWLLRQGSHACYWSLSANYVLLFGTDGRISQLGWMSGRSGGLSLRCVRDN